ncbi:MAG: OB-fold domain-containing protein, partial [Thermosynechococcus sp.]
MFAYLRGTVVAHQSEGGHCSALILDVNGVGYRLLVTS